MLGKEVGSYRILEKIGHGGMGIVYKAIHTKLEQEVAIKVLHPQFSQDPLMRKRFIKEAKIQAKFSHPNVVNILNYLEDEANIFLVMEYVNGETLENRLKQECSLKIEDAVSMSLSVLEALSFMHSEGVIHRDIKPSNIMFTDGGVVKVTDFGIAKVMGEKAQTRTGMVGTFRYMCPEQILGEETTIASDVYSFGITFYEMVTGRVPFDSDSEYKIMKGHLEERPIPPWEINSAVPKKLGMVILKALAKDPKGRYQKVDELGEDIRTAIKKSKGTKIFLSVINSRPWKIPTLNLSRSGFLLLALGIVLLFAVFWSVQKPKDIIPNSSTSAVSKPDTDRSKTDESNLDFEPLILDDTNSEDSGREITKFDDIDNEIDKTGEENKRTLKKVIPSEIYPEIEEPNGERKKDITPFKKDIETKRAKKAEQIRVEQATEPHVEKERILFPEPELKGKHKWKIRK